MSGFENRLGDPTPIPGVDATIQAYVKFADETVTICSDPDGDHPWVPPDFEVPNGETYGFVFTLTASSTAGADFPLDPLKWDGGQPASVTYYKMSPDQRSFSFVNVNTAAKVDLRYSFTLFVRYGGVALPFSRLPFYGQDPTLVDKGEESGPP